MEVKEQKIKDQINELLYYLLKEGMSDWDIVQVVKTETRGLTD